MRIIPKAQRGRPLVSDNTRVTKPKLPIIKKDKYEIGKFFITNPDTKKITLIRPTYSTVKSDNRSTYQKKQDQKKSQKLHEQYRKDKEQKEGAEKIQGLLTFMSPSTYVGPVFNKNGKSYVDNVMSGEGTGDAAGNVAIDMLTPFAIGGARSLTANVARRLPYKLRSSISTNRWNPNITLAYLENGKTNKKVAKFNIFKESLPHSPNSSGDAISLHLSRVVDKSPEGSSSEYFTAGPIQYPYRYSSIQPELIDYTESPVNAVSDLHNEILKSYRVAEGVKNNTQVQKATWVAASSALQKPLLAYPSSGKIYVGNNGWNYIVSKFGENNVSRAISHEIDHALHIPTETPRGFKITDEYFNKLNGTELSARGSQIKDYYGLTKGNQEITEDMLKYASDNYVSDTRIDNNMTEFFNSIVDWKEAAKWLSKHATVIGVPITIGASSYDK